MTDDFYNDVVVQEKDDSITKERKIQLWKKLVGYDEQTGMTFAEMCKLKDEEEDEK
jgi:hypothetical protein